jgi:phosphatidylglycerol lysyltransferase
MEAAKNDPAFVAFFSGSGRAMDISLHSVNTGPPRPSQPRVWLMRIAGLVWLVVLAGALIALHREWSGFHWRDLGAALGRIGPRHLALALLFTVLSYAANVGVWICAQRWSGRPWGCSWRDTGIYFIASAFSINAGGTALGSGSIRMRFAKHQGMSAAEVGKVTLFAVVAGWLGHGVLCGALLLIAPPRLDWVPDGASRLIGAALVGVCVLGMLFGRWIKASKGAWPGARLACLTVLASSLDWLFAGLALWALFPEVLPVAALSFVAIVTIAHAVSAATTVPGGVGVLELTITKMLAGSLAAPTLAGALIAYRLLYYVLPFCVAMVLLGAGELWLRRTRIRSGASRVVKVWSSFAPRLGALLALGGGFMLLLSANTPMEPARREFLAHLFPLPFVEASHFASSIVGALMIVLANGLLRRIQAAWWLTVALTACGIVFSLVKGFDWEEALILAFVLGCLVPFRGHYHRHAALWTQRFTAGWWFVVVGAVAVATWVGFYTARHVPYQGDLWWQFTIRGDAPRFLRALIGSGCVLGVLALVQALRPSRHHPHIAPEPAVIDRLVRESDQADAALAWLDDKNFTISETGNCGLMHAERGRSRIVMGDPLGDTEQADGLLWSFVEQARDEGMCPVFYQVSVAEMPRLVDMGFTLYKLGEQALVSLPDFTVEGAKAQRLRQARRRFQRDGLTFGIWDRVTVAARLETLRAISDAWLAEHSAGEKRFSMGCFDDDYLRHFPCAVVQSATGEVIAFANILATERKNELSVDLMRHLPAAPNGVMEAMFVELMLWGRAEGYQQFNLGMAPLSGFSTHPLAPLWNRLAAVVFRRGEGFYHFQGLRGYKDKFSPQWEPRYIAVPSFWHLPAALLDATALIGGGLRATLRKNKIKPVRLQATPQLLAP